MAPQFHITTDRGDPWRLREEEVTLLSCLKLCEESVGGGFVRYSVPRTVIDVYISISKNVK